MAREIRLYVLVWFALMLLLAATLAGAFAPLGPFKTAVNLGVAAIKAALVFWFYMHLSRQPGLQRIAALGAFAWLAILMLLMGVELSSRGWFET